MGEHETEKTPLVLCPLTATDIIINRMETNAHIIERYNKIVEILMHDSFCDLDFSGEQSLGKLDIVELLIRRGYIVTVDHTGTKFRVDIYSKPTRAIVH